MMAGEPYGGCLMADGGLSMLRFFVRVKSSSSGLSALWCLDAGTGSCCSVGEVSSPSRV